MTLLVPCAVCEVLRHGSLHSWLLPVQPMCRCHPEQLELAPRSVVTTTVFTNTGLPTDRPQWHGGKFDKCLRDLPILLPESLTWARSSDTYSWISQEKTVPKPNIFTRTRKRGNFLVCDRCSCNLLADTNRHLGAILLSCLVSKLQNHSHQGSNQGQLFELWLLFLYLLCKKKFRSWRRSSIVLSSTAVETALAKSRN
jgi:hypothetical protein